ncbi:pimeloyl-ACP methyl ester carboxylesterase [Clavibacter sp. B3I6]|uniref:epoxide hydrolase family protein n=1 Tax=Clavibacter sp. B3I6 TaxID=3042268 RepID=UPI00278BA0BD|nr:epoxide hydrolase family protein [Clavibacter sp. B3I6]MDQ0745664.1 pimeloyl-ACP methyl ester carboxylesterase [Clavibacter sp. B3I6]
MISERTHLLRISTRSEPRMSAITPFRLDVPEADLDDLRRRLLATRWPEPETVGDTGQGPQLARMRRFVERWADGYDWRPTEALLNGWGQHITEVDGLGIHFLHVRSPEPGARPLLLTHGWPGSVLEFRHAIGPLTDPVAHGGSAEDAFHVVIPSLPGFGFSGKPTGTGWGAGRTARAWAELMHRLGYDAWYAQGGDLGASVTSELAALEAAEGIGLRAIHLNMAPFMPTDDEMRDATDEERRMMAETGHYWQQLSGYSQMMSTRPQTVGYGLQDSPAGLAAWIYAMFQDVGGSHDEHGDAEALFALDEMIDDVMLYWLPGTAASAARFYWESAQVGWATPGTIDAPITIPTGLSIMPGEYVRRSRRWAERRYTDLVLFSEVARGGHFALLEQPGLVVDDIRATFRGR